MEDQETTDERLTNLDIYAGLTMAINDCTFFLSDMPVRGIEIANKELLKSVKKLFENMIANTFIHRTEAEHTENVMKLKEDSIRKFMESI